MVLISLRQGSGLVQASLKHYLSDYHRIVASKMALCWLATYDFEINMSLSGFFEQVGGGVLRWGNQSVPKGHNVCMG